MGASLGEVAAANDVYGGGTSEHMRTSWPELPNSIVKSAGRALQVLEYFDDIQREARMVEIARALRYPESSTSNLLKSLVCIGYLRYDRHERSYISTNRARLLGSWIDSSLFKNDRIINLMRALNDDTEDTILLASRNGLHAQYIHVVQARTALRLHLTPGTVRPLTLSVAGCVLLSHLPDAEISKLARRIASEAKRPEDIVPASEVLRLVADIRRSGHVLTRSRLTPGVSILARSIPGSWTNSPLAIAICSPADRMQERGEMLTDLLDARIREFSAGEGAVSPMQ